MVAALPRPLVHPLALEAPVPTTSRTRTAAALLLVPVALGLGACGQLSAVAGLPTGTTSSAPASAPATTPAATPSPVEVVPVQNDLALGSAHHELQAGGVGVAVDYWSTLDMGKWTAGAAKPIMLAATLTGANLGTAKKQQKAYISAFSVTSTAVDASGAVSSPVTVQDVSRQSPGYLAMAPYAYSTSFVVPAVSEGVRSVQLIINYDVLEQSAPGAADYSKATATDTLTVAIAEDGSASVTGATTS